MISGIGWVSELVAAAGGIDVFAALRGSKSAKDRIVSADDVIAAAPDIIVGSWCGKKFVPAKVAARPGFADIPAVRHGWLREIKSPLILQPGPAALTDGLDAMATIIAEWASATRNPTGAVSASDGERVARAAFEPPPFWARRQRRRARRAAGRCWRRGRPPPSAPPA